MAMMLDVFSNWGRMHFIDETRAVGDTVHVPRPAPFRPAQPGAAIMPKPTLEFDRVTIQRFSGTGEVQLAMPRDMQRCTVDITRGLIIEVTSSWSFGACFVTTPPEEIRAAAACSVSHIGPLASRILLDHDWVRDTHVMRIDLYGGFTSVRSARVPSSPDLRRRRDALLAERQKVRGTIRRLDERIAA
jgi:hypothetical protein